MPPPAFTNPSEPSVRSQPGADAASRWQLAERALRWLVALLSCFLILLFLVTALRRLHYPFDLEWIESGILVSVGRISHGLPLYTAPSLTYIPYLYAPLYLYLCAAVAKLTGVTFLTLRLVSTGSALATFALLFVFVRRETRNTLAATAAVGLYASMYPVSGAWFDIGRVDSLFLLLFLLALFSTRFAPPWLAAIAWVLAFQTKQTMLPLAIPFLLLYWERQRPYRVVVALGTYALLAGGSILAFNHATHGWYSYYLFGAVVGLPGVVRMLALYVPEVLLAPLSTALVLIGAAALLAPVAWRTRRAVFYVLGSLMLYAAFWYVHWHRGVGNTMLALDLWTALLFGLAVARLLHLSAAWDARTGNPSQGRLAGPALPGAARPAAVLVLLAILAQLGAGIYNPGQYVPTQTTLAAREAFLEQVRSIPGDVYILNHSFDDELAGKQPFAEGEAIGAVVDAKGTHGPQEIAALRAAFLSHHWSAIALDDPPTDYVKWFTPEDLAAYPVRVPAAGGEALRFLTSQPRFLLLPCTSLTDGLAARLSIDGRAPSVSACNTPPAAIP